MRNQNISWRVATAIALFAVLLIVGCTLAMSFAPNNHSSDSANHMVQMIAGPLVVILYPTIIYLLVLEGRFASANRSLYYKSGTTIFGRPGRVIKVIVIQMIVSVICGVIAYDIWSRLLPRSNADTHGFDVVAIILLGYWCLASPIAAILLLRRSRLGWALSWTIFPAIVPVVPNLISLDMTDYLSGGFAEQNEPSVIDC